MLKLVTVAAFVVTGCNHPSFIVHRPDDPKADAAVTALWAQEIRRVARDGDWILTRSYFAVADAITLVAPGEPLSHASIYDAHHDSVIEAVGDGVREIPLAQLLDRNHYAIVVRPRHMSARDEADALARARSQLGAPFSISGMLGLEDEEGFYCSELVYWAAQTADRGGTDRVITPSDLLKYGEVIYWSGKRDEIFEPAEKRTAERDD